MPVFSLQSPEGETYKIEAPEGATEAQAYEMLQKKLAGRGKGGGKGKEALPTPEKGVEGALVNPNATSRSPLDTQLLDIVKHGSSKGMPPDTDAQRTAAGFPPTPGEVSLGAPAGRNERDMGGGAPEGGQQEKGAYVNPVLAAPPGTLPGESGSIEATPSRMREFSLKLNRMLGRESAPLTGVWKGMEEFQQKEEERRREAEEADRETGFNPQKIAKEGITAGAIAGATPELLVSGGRAVGRRFPVAGAAMIGAGEVMKATRGANILVGVLGGAAGEATQQGLQEMDAPAWAQVAGNIAGNILGGNVGRLAAHIPSASRSFAAYFYKSVKAAEDAERRAQPFKAFSDLIGKTDRRAEAYEMLQKGAAAHEQAAASYAADIRRKAYGAAQANPGQAPAIIERAEAEAKQVVADARAARDKMEKLSKGRTETAKRVNAQADVSLNRIAPAVTEEHSGQKILGAVDSAHRHMMESRSSAYKAQEAVIGNIVQSKERAGVTVHETPAYQQLLAEVRKHTSPTILAKTSEPTGLAAYKKIEDTLKGVEVDGVRVKNSYEALDELRRKLGDAAKFGEQVEGYGAIGAKRAGELYKKISEIQREFVGPANFDKLQGEYAAASKALDPYGKGLGKRLVGADGAAMLDPTRVGSATFYSPSRVRLAKELTSGRPEVVDQAAREYVSRQLAGRDAKGMKDWLKAAEKNGWLGEVKGLQGEISSHIARVEKIERVEGKLQASQAKFAKGAKDVMAGASSKVDEISKEARATLLKGTEKLREEGFPKIEVSRMIRTGSKAENQAAARLLMGQPGGRAALTEAITNELSRVPQNKIADAWDTRYRDLLFKSGLMPEKELASMEVKVQRALREGKSPQFIHAMIISGITSGVSMAGRLQREFGRSDEDVLQDIGGQ